MTKLPHDPKLLLDAADADALARGMVGDPFALLGPHTDGDTAIVRAFLPPATRVEAIAGDGSVLADLQPIQTPGLFAGRIPFGAGYRLRIHWPHGVQETEDPYSFGLLLGEIDMHLFAEGRHYELGRCLGAQPMTIHGVPGVRFAVWAPNARRVSVVGAFNGWDGRRHIMRLRRESGLWELFIPRLHSGEYYKYEILGANGLLPLKADPVGLASEPPPGTASAVMSPQEFRWNDAVWMAARTEHQQPHRPLSIYELHAGSWRRNTREHGRSLSWDELAEQLIPYVVDLGFTHIELLPIMEHPFGGSWGYQPLGLYAPTARYGPPDAFARFIDACHAAGIGVILDWVPAHFPTDEHGLAHFDGTALYEHADPREGFHQDWNTAIYNFGRHEVSGFLIASALHWLERYHIDGLRVDAVASMLYRDYSRKAGEWIPNRYGGRENLEAIAFIRNLNEAVAARCPGALVFAEESTDWPGVSHAVREGGLGFSYKWNMGWMHDTLKYLARDSIHRAWHHNDITFGLLYAFSERFVLPLSHDEVVHGKGSLIRKMAGDRWQRFANLRAYFALMWSYPGKKLLFMGGELAQEREWNHDSALDWHLLGDPLHAGMQRLVRDLNHLYVNEPALHQRDCDGGGFHWIVVDDKANSVFAWLRHGHDGAPVLMVANMTPTPHRGYRVGVPVTGAWRELLNTDSGHYGGGDVGNGGTVIARNVGSHGQPASIELTLPPLGTILLRHDEHG
jgi:1,4-alpha-glucan branching enzyme